MFTYVFLEEIGTRDVGVGTGAGGLGGRIVYQLAPYVDLDIDIIVHPNAGVSGSRIQGLFGAKAGKRLEKIGLFVKARPGFLYFRKDPFGASDPGSTLLRSNWADSMEPSIDLGGVLEYYTERGAIVRFDIGDTIINYEPRTVFLSQFLSPLTAADSGLTTDNGVLGWGGDFDYAR